MHRSDYDLAALRAAAQRRCASAIRRRLTALTCAFSVQLPKDPRPESLGDARGVLRALYRFNCTVYFDRALPGGGRRYGLLLSAYNKDHNNCFGSVETVATIDAASRRTN